METKSLRRTAVLALLSLLVAAAVLVSATYAWFTNSNRVSTTLTTARSGNDDVELQISSTGGTEFTPVEAAPITQVNDADLTQLLPVTTADLEAFLTAAVTGPEAVYTQVEDGSRLFHGRVYLRCVAQEGQTGTMGLYLDDNTLSLLSGGGDSQLLNAARLGLVFDSGERYLFYLTQAHNPAGQQIRNTWLNGEQVPDGSVLTLEEGRVTAVADPSRPITDFMLSSAEGFLFPPAPLCTLVPGEIRTVEVYFYLEGCDPDCSDAVSFDAADLALAFYGVFS